MVERAAKVVLFLVGPDVILVIIGRAASTDSTAILGVVVDIRILVCLVWCNGGSGLSVRSFVAPPLAQ